MDCSITKEKEAVRPSLRKLERSWQSTWIRTPLWTGGLPPTALDRVGVPFLVIGSSHAGIVGSLGKVDIMLTSFMNQIGEL
jgi:hypothetical protein